MNKSIFVWELGCRGPGSEAWGIGVAWNLSELVPHKVCRMGQVGGRMGNSHQTLDLGHPAGEADKLRIYRVLLTQGDVESTGHRQSCDISAAHLCQVIQKWRQADSVGWPWTLKPHCHYLTFISY